MDTQESRQQNEENSVLALQSSVGSIGGKVSSLENASHSLDSRLDKQELEVSFYANFNQDSSGHSYNVSVSKTAPVAFNHVMHNSGNGYNATTGKFTTPYAGGYLFSLEFMASGQGTVHLSISWSTADGSRTGYGCAAFAEGVSQDSNDQGSCTVLLHMSKGNQVYVKASYHQDSHPVIWSGFTSFSGILLFPQ